MVDRLALARETRLVVALHDALTSPLPDRGAQVGFRVLAHNALRAVRLVARDNVVPRDDVGHALPDALDDARRLVAEDARKEALRVESAQRVRVRVAQRGGHDLDADLVPLGRSDLDLADLQRLLRLPGNRGLARDYLASSLGNSSHLGGVGVRSKVGF